MTAPGERSARGARGGGIGFVQRALRQPPRPRAAPRGVGSSHKNGPVNSRRVAGALGGCLLDVANPLEFPSPLCYATGLPMTTAAHDTVQKLWNLCNVLRDDGITYHQYVTELVFLLFLKMAKETGQERDLPKGWRWNDLIAHEDASKLRFYEKLLRHLGANGDERVREIFSGATTSLRKSQSLKKIVESIDTIAWFSTHRERLGDVYEGLLEKNASELKSGAGQYFTPRPLVDCMVALVKPRVGEVIQDPAAGTAGFLIAANQYIKTHSNGHHVTASSGDGRRRHNSFVGVELVPETRRLALMNLLLHNIRGEVHVEDSLSPFGASLAKADVILTNPPFGNKQGGSKPTREDFVFQTSNKQLAFVEHVYRGLRPGGRAAVVVPDNVLFEENVGAELRRDLMDFCDLHTVLRLPSGIFYAPGVKTNVIFFSRGNGSKQTTKATWFYDLRANMPSFGKRRKLTRDDFVPFEKAFGDDPLGRGERRDEGEGGRWRCHTREEIRARGDNLDIPPLKDYAAGTEEPDDHDAIAAEVVARLEAALTGLKGMLATMGREPHE